MNRLSFKNNRFIFKTSRKLAIHLKEYKYRIFLCFNKEKPTQRRHTRGLVLETLMRTSTDYVQKSPWPLPARPVSICTDRSQIDTCPTESTSYGKEVSVRRFFLRRAPARGQTHPLVHKTKCVYYKTNPSSKNSSNQ